MGDTDADRSIGADRRGDYRVAEHAHSARITDELECLLVQELIGGAATRQPNCRPNDAVGASNEFMLLTGESIR